MRAIVLVLGLALALTGCLAVRQRGQPRRRGRRVRRLAIGFALDLPRLFAAAH